MQLIFATLHVGDLEASIQFYVQVMGMKPVRRFFGGPTLEIAFLADGPAQLELICDSADKKPSYGEFPSLAFATDNLDRSLAEMRAHGIKIAGGPIQPNPDTRFFFIQDPDGQRLQIIEQK